MPLADYIPMGVAATVGAVGYGELRARVSTLRRDVDTKASSEVVGVQYAEIIRRLDRIERNSDAAIKAAEE